MQRAIGLDDQVRSEVMAGFKARGGSLDRWQRRDWEAMREAVTRAEDSLELARPRLTAAREALRGCRRELEGDG